MDEKVSNASEPKTGHVPIIFLKCEPVRIKDEFPSENCVLTDIKEGQAYLALKSECSGGTYINDDSRGHNVQFYTNYAYTVKQESKALIEMDHSTATSDIQLIATTDITQSDAHECGLTDTQIHHCDICQQSFGTAEDLIAHRYTHTEDANFRCLLCPNTFNMKQGLYKHMLSIHTNLSPFQHDIWYKPLTQRHNVTARKRIRTVEKLYVCDMCHKTFKQKSNLTRHKRIHSGEKPYECDICHKSFTQMGEVTIHKRIHSGEKPFQCDICHQSFTRNGELTIHKRIHSGEKPYECDICHKLFTRKDKHTIHKRIHSGEKMYKCDICYKSFTQRNNLTVHTRSHTGEKPYECDICHNSFTQKGDLTVHKRTHTGEKPYVCDICNISFMQKGNLNVHKRIHISA